MNPGCNLYLIKTTRIEGIIQVQQQGIPGQRYFDYLDLNDLTCEDWARPHVLCYLNLDFLILVFILIQRGFHSWLIIVRARAKSELILKTIPSIFNLANSIASI